MTGRGMSETSPHILVDADACPVKEEVYKVAFRHEVPVTVVSNGGIRIPDHPLIQRIVVPADPDAADDWIAERANAASVIVTADILLAERGVSAFHQRFHWLGCGHAKPDGRAACGR